MSSAEEDLAQAQVDIRSTGLRATPARTASLVMLRNSDSPLTHADVALRLAKSGIDKATAFRNLNDMTDAGLLRRSELGDHVWRFEAIDPNAKNRSGHPHFLCVDCGAVQCLTAVELTASSRRESERFGQVTEILLRGHCNTCCS